MEEKFFQATRKMIKINRKHKCFLDSKVSSFGLHTTQHRVLMHIARTGNLLSQKELALHLDITPAAVTQILQKLELDGYIERKLGSDNRFNEIKITDLGKDIVEKTKKVFSSIDKSLFKDFTDEEMDTFIEFLVRIDNNMEVEKENEKMV